MNGGHALPALRDDVRALALNFSPLGVRSELHALWALDEALGQVVRSTTEPIIGQMRLTWWHDRLCGLDSQDPVAEPLLAGLSALLLSLDISGASLAGLVEGWEALLDPLPLSDSAIATHAVRRGAHLFQQSARILAATDDVDEAGKGWAAMDFAARCSDADTADRAQAYAAARLAGCAPPHAKPLRILTRLAQRSATRSRTAQPSRFAILRSVLF
jgi:15-cis-phytoene synthase